jgi:alkylation response protein AidB-like acyl-CoA dehydrogenase
VIAERLHELAQTGELQLPPPGAGQTRQRWAELAGFAREDVVLGRLAEAHTDAAAILVELGAQPVQPGQVWGVWAAEPPAPVVHAHRAGAQWQLSGQKLWCSGAHTCTHTLLTARVGEQCALFAVDLAQQGVSAVPDTWPAVGMAASDSGAVALDRADAVMVGAAGDYLSRPGFWHGAIGVAASWYGGACGVADALVAKAATGRADEHALAHLGHVSTALSGARWALAAAAEEVDADPRDEQGAAQSRAHRVRALVEAAATQTMQHVGRALGAGPLCTDGAHAHRVADLTVYLRQSHAERDLAVLGRLVAENGATW